MPKIKGTFTAEDGTKYTGELSYEEMSYKRPRAERGGKYYCFDNNGVIDSYIENSNMTHDYRYSIGNYALTKEELIKKEELTQARVRIEDAVREHNGEWKADWSDSTQHKFRIIFDWGMRGFRFYENTTDQTPNAHFLKDNNRDFLKKHEADLKLIMGITN